MWYKNVDTSFFRFTKHAYDRRTDTQTDKMALQYLALHDMQSHSKKTAFSYACVWSVAFFYQLVCLSVSPSVSLPLHPSMQLKLEHVLRLLKTGLNPVFCSACI